MTLGEPFTQKTHETFFASLRETRGAFIAPTLLPVCCVCGLIRDDSSCLSGLDCWLTQRTYHEGHGVDPTEVAQTHTYCPECLKKAQERVQPSIREIGTIP